MSNGLQQDMVDTAIELLNELGTEAVLERPGASSYSPRDREVTRSSPELTDILISPPTPVESGWRDFALEENDAETYTADPSGMMWEAGMVIIFKQERWKVVGVRPYYSGAVVAVTQLLLRK